MSLAQDYLQLIRSVEPAFDPERVELAGGQTHDVVIVDGARVYRFARSAATAAELRREVALLHALQDRLPLAIPSPDHVQLAGGAEKPAYYRYPRVPGVPLTRRMLAVRDDAALRRLVLQLAGFLIALHSLPPVPGLPQADNPASIVRRWHSLYERIRTRLYPLMRPDARAEVSAHFAKLFAELGAHPVVPTLVHGDFGAGNILVQPDALIPLGVIDFSSAGLDDPAVDWAALATLHPGALDIVREAFPALEPELRRVPLYRGTFALQEALIGVEQGDEAALRAGLQNYV